MAQIKISQLTTGTPQGTDETPATDPLDTSSATTGTTKKYIRADEFNFYIEALGLRTLSSCVVGTTVALTAVYANGVLGVGATLTNSGVQAALSIDGIALAVNDRVLVKNQVAGLQNGIYRVSNIGSGSTNWVLTRALDYDQAAEVIQYDVVLVNRGTLNAGVAYQEIAPGPFIMGTTAIQFQIFTMQSLSLPVSLAQGGTSAALTANNGGIFYSTATAGAILSGTATVNQVLLSGANSAPAWSTATYPATTLASNLLYSNGANTITGLATANSATLITNPTGVPAWTASMTNGQVLIGSTGATPTLGVLNAGAGISILNGAGSITILSGGLGSWLAAPATPVPAVVNTGYYVTDAAQVTFTLPVTAPAGSIVAIVGNGAGGWILKPGAGQTVKVLAASAGTSITSAEQYDCIEVICTVADTTWVARSMVTTGFTIV